MRGSTTSRAPFVAVRSFSYVDRLGCRQSIVARRTHVALESEDYQRFPEAFAPVEGAAQSMAASSAATAQTPPVQLRSLATLPNTIYMARSIRLAIDSEVGRSQCGSEAGGFLIGRQWERGVQVLDVLGLPTARRGSHFIELDGGSAERFLLQFPSSMRIVGTFHSHPGASHAPSPFDIAAWATFFMWYPECRASLVLVPDLDNGWRWARPQVHAYMLRTHRRDGTVLVEPASVEVA
jgi:proteasome lid subunit RPN8/RPN11